MPYVMDDPNTLASTAATNAYYAAKTKNESNAQALAAAQQAWTQEYQRAQLSGYLGGQATMPNIQYTSGAFGQYLPGGFKDLQPNTPTTDVTGALGYMGYIPGYTGTGAGQTGSALAQQASTAQGAAGLTGWYAAPAQSRYTPGSFVRLDPSTYDTNQYGDVQISYVTGTGQMQRVNLPQAKAMGWDGDLSKMNVIPAAEAIGLERAAPTQLPQQTLEGLTTYGNLNEQAIRDAIAQSGVTGMYTAPGQITPPGTNAGGGKFSDLDQGTQQAYLISNGSDWSAAQAKWVADSNKAIQQAYTAAGGQGTAPGIGTAGTPTQTLGAQSQYWEQAFKQAQANQANTQAYLTLLSNLRGPADWAKYQQVLGSTPQGMRDLYAASMGQYTPGGGATSGQAPQAADLGTMQQQIGGQGYGYGYGQMPSQPYTTQPGVPQTPGQTWGGGYGQTPGGGSNQVWGSGIGIGQQGATPEQQQQATGNGTNMWGGQQQQYNLPAPNQIAAQSWNNLAPSQQQMMLGMYEANGWDKNDVQALYNQSLPKYGSSGQSTGGTWRMQ